MKYTRKNSSAPAVASKKSTGTTVTQSRSSSTKTGKTTPKYHYVQPGDTLWTISQKYGGLSVERIKKLNNIKGSTIKVGQKLILG